MTPNVMHSPQIQAIWTCSDKQKKLELLPGDWSVTVTAYINDHAEYSGCMK